MELTKNEQMVLDKINQTIADKVEAKNQTMQKQLDKLFERTDKMNFVGATSAPDRKEANQWLKKFFSGHKDLEQKEGGFDNYMANDPDSAGGYLVPTLLAQEIAHYVLESGMSRMRMRYMPFTGIGNTRRIPKELQGVSVSWIDEGEAKPLTKITLGEVLHQLKKLASVCVITEELAEDSGLDLVAYVSRRIGEAIAREEDRTYLAGDTTLGDPFNGILNVAGTQALSMNAGQGIADVTADHLLNLIYQVSKEARTGAAFYCNSDVLFRLQLLKDSENRYLVSRPITEGEPNRIWGYPVYTTDVLPSIEDNEADMPFMFFANLQKTAVYGDKMAVRVKLLTESSLTDSEGNTVNLAQNDMIGIRVHKRTGYACVHAEGIAVLNTGEAT